MISTTRTPTDLLLVLDESGSMAVDPATQTTCLPAATCPSKWNQTRAAINQVVAGSTGIRWGLKLFSDPGQLTCAVSTSVQVPVALDSASLIAAALSGAPGGPTPTTLGITRAGDYLASLTTPNPRFLVLLTDGQPTCGPGTTGTSSPDDAAAIAAVAAQAARGLGTFVIGIGTANDAAAVLSLTMMSTVGMHPRAGTPNFYVANNTADLVASLEAIEGVAGGCTFALASVPPNPAAVRVQADGVTVPPNDVDGWVYAPGFAAIDLRGTYCQAVRNHTIQSVVLQFGCGL